MMHSPLHPGRFLKEAFLDEFEISRNELAKHIGVARSSVAWLVEGKTDVSIDMAIRLSAGVHGSPDFWLTMQKNYDLWKNRKKTSKKIDRTWIVKRASQVGSVQERKPAKKTSR